MAKVPYLIIIFVLFLISAGTCAGNLTAYDLKIKEAKSFLERLAYPEAIKFFEEAIGLEASRPESYYYLAVIYERQGLFDRAMTFWEKRYAINPQDKGGREAREHVVFLNIIKEREKFIKTITLPEKLEKMHFIVYHQNYFYASDIVFKAELAYKTILQDLGVVNFPWWDRFKCVLLLFPNKDLYLSSVSAPAWSGGLAQYSRFLFATFEKAPGLEEKTLPHELSHLALQMFMGNEVRIPLWLNEGLAKYEEEGSKDYLYFLKDNLVRGKFYHLPEFFAMSEYPAEPALFYAQSASLIYYLKEKNINSLFAQFLLEIKEGLSVDQALKEVYQWKFRNGAVDLEKKWREEIH